VDNVINRELESMKEPTFSPRNHHPESIKVGEPLSPRKDDLRRDSISRRVTESNTAHVFLISTQLPDKIQKLSLSYQEKLKKSILIYYLDKPDLSNYVNKITSLIFMCSTKEEKSNCEQLIAILKADRIISYPNSKSLFISISDSDNKNITRQDLRSLAKLANDNNTRIDCDKPIQLYWSGTVLNELKDYLDEYFEYCHPKKITVDDDAAAVIKAEQEKAARIKQKYQKQTEETSERMKSEFKSSTINLVEGQIKRIDKDLERLNSDMVKLEGDLKTKKNNLARIGGEIMNLQSNLPKVSVSTTNISVEKKLTPQDEELLNVAYANQEAFGRMDPLIAQYSQLLDYLNNLFKNFSYDKENLLNTLKKLNNS